MPSSRVVASLVAEFYTRAIPLWVSGDLADLGCGNAPLLGAYTKYCDSVLLVDWENSEHPNPLLDITLDLNQPLAAIDSESLDTVLLSDVLEHIREPAELLAEIWRILRPGGYLVMNVPFTYRLHERPHDYYRYTSYALEYLTTAAGFEVVELSALGGWLEIMADMWGKLFSAARLHVLSAIIHRVAVIIYRTPLGRKFAAVSGAIWPLGYGLAARKPARLTAESSGTD
jgi:SAM-dependent methyltransferase